MTYFLRILKYFRIIQSLFTTPQARQNPSSFQFQISRDFAQIFHVSGLVINVAAIVVNSVRDEEIISSENTVVRGNLRENLLRDRHRGGFVFNDGAWAASIAVVKHTVATARNTANLEAHFVAEKSGGVALVFNQKMNKVLAHPFFGRERDIAAAQEVENKEAPPLRFRFYIEGGEI